MTSKAFSWSTTGDDIVQASADRVKGRTFLITGVSKNSLGAETAMTLARHGSPAQIILAGRFRYRIDPVIAKIKELNPDVKVFFVPLELTEPSSIRAAARQILSYPKFKNIDVLMNYAGIGAFIWFPCLIGWRREEWPDLQLGANHCGHFIFTNLLLQKLRRGAPGARIVNLAGSGHRLSGIRLDDACFEVLRNGVPYDPWETYGQSKTANILIAVHLGSKIPSHEIASFSVNPGGVPSDTQCYIDPQMIEGLLPRIEKIPDFDNKDTKTKRQLIVTGLVAALDPGLEAHSGAYLSDCQIAVPAEHARGKDRAERLWKITEEIAAQEFPI